MRGPELDKTLAAAGILPPRRSTNPRLSNAHEAAGGRVELDCECVEDDTPMPVRFGRDMGGDFRVYLVGEDCEIEITRALPMKRLEDFISDWQHERRYR